jgi:chemotaxis regulatin CheY-phosphate phosphatase CheZ
LTTLDLAVNKLERFDHLDHLGESLHELWLNWNNFIDDESNRKYLKKFVSLETLYLADNPLANHSEY